MRAGLDVVLAGLAHELGKAARVLGLEARTSRQGLEATHSRGHALALESFGRRRLTLEKLAAVHATRAGTDHDEAPEEPRVCECKIAGDVGAHRTAAEMSLSDAKVAKEPVKILDEDPLRIRCSTLGNARRRIPAMVVGDHAVAPTEVAHLGLPRSEVPTELVTPDQRSPAPGLLVVDIDVVVDLCDGHHALLAVPRGSRRTTIAHGASRLSWSLRVFTSEGGDDRAEKSELDVVTVPRTPFLERRCRAVSW